MSPNKYYYLIAGLCLLLVISVSQCSTAERNIRRAGREILSSDTTIIVRIDTVRVDRPVPVKVTAVRRDTVWLWRAGDEPTADSLRRSDSVRVVVPITRRTYRDSNYMAIVSGYNPSLDLIEIYPRHITSTITQSIPVRDRRRWGIGIQLGYGAILAPNGRIATAPYLGVGISWNVFNL